MKMSLIRGVAVATVSAFSAFSAFADNLENLLPKNANMIVSVDCKRIMNLPFISEMKKTDADFSAGWTEMEQKVAAQGLKLDEIATSAVIFALDDGNSGMLLRTGVSEEKFESLIQSDAFGKPPYSVEKSGDKKFFIFKDPASAAASSLPGLDALQMNPILKKYSAKDPALCYIRPGTVLISDYESSKAILTLMNASTGPKQSLLDKKSSLGADPVFWLVFDKAPKAPAPGKAPSPMMNPAEMITGGAVAADFTGKTGEDCNLDASVDFNDAQSASTCTMQIQGLLMMLGGSAFQGDPQLGMDVVSAIKIKNQDKQVKVSMLITKSLQTRFKEYTAKMAAMDTAPVGLTPPSDDFKAPKKPKKVMPKTAAPEDSLVKEAPLAQ